MNVLSELEKKEDENKTEETPPKEEKKEGFVFKTSIPELHLHVLKIRFRKGEYVTKDKKEAEALRKIKGIKEVTQK